MNSKEKTINKKNKILYLKFAKEFINKDNSFWDTILFSDDYNIFDSDGRKRWRKQNIQLEARTLRPSIKYNSGIVMI